MSVRPDADPGAAPDPDPGPAPDQASGPTEREPEWRRRQRLAAVFGESGPDQTKDDRDAREDRAGKGDEWYREQVPPHHG